MEGGAESVTEDAPPSEEEWIADWLDGLCPYYMFLGVPCDEFWHGDYTQLKYYVRAHDLRKQNMSDTAWLQGLYIYNAVGTALGNAFKKKGRKPLQYMESPIRITPLTEAEQKIQTEKERQKTIDYFNRLAKQWEKKNEP